VVDEITDITLQRHRDVIAYLQKTKKLKKLADTWQPHTMRQADVQRQRASLSEESEDEDLVKMCEAHGLSPDHLTRDFS
jgi:hypothetical protein